MFFLLAVLLAAPPSRADQREYIFNPTLSLTGDCSTSSADSVPDPGPCPGEPGQDHPTVPFAVARVTALDQYGNRYVVSYGTNEEGTGGRIDIFTPDGLFIREIALQGVAAAAVDGEGNLYYSQFVPGHGGPGGLNGLFRLEPTTWGPGVVEYGAPPVRFGPDTLPESLGYLAVDPSSGHIFFRSTGAVEEFASAGEGNQLKGRFGEGEINGGRSLSVDSQRNRVYVAASEFDGKTTAALVRIFELGGEHKPIGIIDGSTTPAGKFLGEAVSVAVDEESGHVFVGDLAGTKKRVYELEPDGGYIEAIEKSPTFQALVNNQQISFDNGAFSPNREDLFVPSGQSPPSHAFVYEPKALPKPPTVISVSAKGITRAGAILEAKINGDGESTTYRLEYTSEQSFEEEGFAMASVAREGLLAPGLEDVTVSTAISGLAPGTGYRFRAVAENDAGEAERQAGFATYPELEAPSACSNEALRMGPSATLPDCRAYELVTPFNTNGHTPQGIGNTGSLFATREASPDGGALSFRIAGGPIPGFAGTGSLYGDPYLSIRNAGGWTTVAAGPNGTEAPEIAPGGTSSDQGYSFWENTGPPGMLAKGVFVRYPDGHFELIAPGSSGSASSGIGHQITPGGTHIIFSTKAQLEPGAPAGGTRAIYDRTPDEVTHLVSLLPGDAPLGEGQNAEFLGSSRDGRAVAFAIFQSTTTPLYLRLDNAKTYEAAPPGSTFEGLDEDGSRLFYLQGGDLYAFDVASEQPLRFTESGDVTVVNVSEFGEVAYFVSPSVLTAQPNPRGDAPQPGAENLYRSREGQIGFVATVTERDVAGNLGGNIKVGGLGLWAAAAIRTETAVDPSRTTSDGSALLFESGAELAGYDPEGHAQVYRYDAGAGTLRCISCPPTRTPATGEANLQSIAQDLEAVEPLSQFGFVESLSADGKRAFFESTEALVLEDRDGLRDVYEWEEQGTGSCQTPGGCVYLISSGKSARANFLYAATPSGDDVFFRSSDLLVPRDQDETPSIYDARVGGGFGSPAGGAGECLGEACQPTVTAPESPPLGSEVIQGSGNVTGKPPGRRSCPKGKRKVRHGGKAKCAPAHTKHRHHKRNRSSSKRRTHR
ncbi:MAG: hypothetical protein ACJ76D_08720 [Solirubrobacterales bacterium]